MLVPRRVYPYLDNFHEAHFIRRGLSFKPMIKKLLNEPNGIPRDILRYIHCYVHEIPVCTEDYPTHGITVQPVKGNSPMYILPSTPRDDDRIHYTCLQPWSLGTFLGVLHAAAATRNTWEFWNSVQGTVHAKSDIQMSWLQPNTPYDLLLYVLATWTLDANKQITAEHHPSMLVFPRTAEQFSRETGKVLLTSELYTPVDNQREPLEARVPVEGKTILGLHNPEARPYRGDPAGLAEKYAQFKNTLTANTDPCAFYTSCEVPMIPSWLKATPETAHAFMRLEGSICLAPLRQDAPRVGDFVATDEPTVAEFTPVPGPMAKAGAGLAARKLRAVNSRWVDGRVLQDTHFHTWDQFSKLDLNANSANDLFHAILNRDGFY